MVRFLHFCDWLRLQTAREDATGLLALTICGEMERIGKRLVALDDRAVFLRYASELPVSGVSAGDAERVWDEWAGSRAPATVAPVGR